MADHTKIEWTDATWNPITGCSVVSPGCTNCYAMKLAGGRLKHHPSRKGLTKPSKAGPVWTGEVRFNEEWLTQPMRWTKPRKIFPCAHGDLFAENVPDEWIDKVFAVMALCPQHQFTVLTKRSDRMLTYFNHVNAHGETRHEIIERKARFFIEDADAWMTESWPLPNVWLGVSVEDQERAAARIPDLLNTPAAVRFISAEPLLGPVDLTKIELSANTGFYGMDALTGMKENPYGAIVERAFGPCLDWVIVGGESGHRHRDMDLQWARDLRDQCKAANVAFFMKQVAGKGEIPPDLMVREMPG